MDVVETGGSPSDRALNVTELPLLEVMHGLCEVVGSEVKEGEERRPQSLRTVIHDRSGGRYTTLLSSVETCHYYTFC